MLLRTRNTGPRRSGAAAVEMAAVLPVFIALVLGQIETSRLGMVQQLLSVAAREACRTAVIPNATSDTVKARIDEVLAGSGIRFSTLTTASSDPGTAGAYVTPSNWNSTSLSAGTEIDVTLRVNYSQVAWLPTPRFISQSATVTARAAMSAERY